MAELILKALETRGLVRRSGPTVAVAGVDFGVAPGEIRALVGENGAGKSTLMKLLSGVIPPDEGEILLGGGPFRPSSPGEAREAGVVMVHQELALAPHLLDHRDISPDARVGSLSIAEQQIVEIARALLRDARVLILDEPTSSLSRLDVERLFRLIPRLAEPRLSLTSISHFLEEVFEIADTYTVLRDGRSVGEGTIEGASVQKIVRLMVGREIEEMFPRSKRERGEVVLEGAGLRGRVYPLSASFELRRGEV